MYRSMNIKSLAVAVSALVLSTSVNAAIIDLGNITRDTSTDLDWLDVTETRGMSYNDVLAQTATGGTFEGWRYATIDELDQLVYNLGFGALATPSNPNCSVTGADFCAPGVSLNGVYYETLLKNAIDLLGDTRAAYEAEHPEAIIGVAGPTADNWGISGLGGVDGLLVDQYAGDQIIARLHYQTDQLFTGFNVQRAYSAYPDVGSFLVQSQVSSVPVPAAVWLFGSGLLGLVGVARRKKA